MRVELKSKHRLWIGLLAIIGLVIGSAFNSCSNVHFATQNQKAADGNNGGLCVPGTTGCFTGTPVNYDDKFIASSNTNKADILLVLDDSGSMTADLLKLADKMDGLLQILDNGGVDWQMCYTTTHVDQNKLAGRALDWQNLDNANKLVDTGTQVLLPSTSDKLNIFLNTMGNIQSDADGSGNEQAIRAAELAVADPNNAGCFRADAALSVVVISDEDEKSCGGRCKSSSNAEAGTPHWNLFSYTNQYSALNTNDSPQTFVSDVQSIWPEKSLTVHSIVIKDHDTACWNSQDKASPAFYGIVYGQLQSLTGGILGDICASSFADQLSSMGQRTLDAINSVTLKCAPYGTPMVTISPPDDTVTWKVIGNKISFSQPLAMGTTVEVQYQCLQ